MWYYLPCTLKITGDRISKEEFLKARGKIEEKPKVLGKYDSIILSSMDYSVDPRICWGAFLLLLGSG